MQSLQHYELARVLLQVAVILGTARVLGVAAKRLGQPAVVAEIVAGILLGPSLLGWASPVTFNWLFPIASLPGLKLLSQFGLVLFMFLVGLELDPKLLRGRAHTTLLVGLASIVVPLALGLAGAPWLHARFGEGVSFWPFAAFVGTAMSVTAFPLLARILSERHLLATRVGAIAIACAAVDGLTAWCLMTLLVGVARADDWFSGLRIGALTLGLVVSMAVAFRPLLGRAIRRIETRGVGPASLTVVLLPLLLVSAVSEFVGVHALFGAFLFGAVLPKDGPLAESVADKLEAVTLSLLLPVFFAYSGLRTELTLVDERAEWIAFAFVMVIAIAGKFGGSALVGRAAGLPLREALAVGVLLNARGLMGLIVLNVGLDLGIVSPRLFAMLVLMALATTLAATPLLRLLYPDRDIIAARFAPELAPSPAPGGKASPDEHDAVVACVSDPRSGQGLARLAQALAGDGPNASRVFGLHLSEPSARVTVDMREDKEPLALASFLEHTRALGVEARGIAFVSMSPGDDIVRIAEAKKASMILLGAHDPWWLEGRLDGVVGSVLRRADRAVGVLVGADRSPPSGKFRRILVAHAGREDDPALATASRFARQADMHVVVLSIRASDGPEPDVVPAHGCAVRVVRAEDAAAALYSAVEHESADLVVIARAGRWLLSGDRMGRSRKSLFERINVPLLVVHDGAVVAGAPNATEGLA